LVARLSPDNVQITFILNVVYSVPAAGSLNAQLVCRQSVVIGCKLERRSNSVIADASHCERSVGDVFFFWQTWGQHFL